MEILCFSKLTAKRIGGIAVLCRVMVTNLRQRVDAPNELQDILKKFICHSTQKTYIRDHHYENPSFILEAVDLPLDETRAKNVRILENCFIEFLNEEGICGIFPKGFPDWALEHAAILETSLMVYLRPNPMRLDRNVPDKADNLLPYDIHPVLKDFTPSSDILANTIDTLAQRTDKSSSDTLTNSRNALIENFCKGGSEGPNTKNETFRYSYYLVIN